MVEYLLIPAAAAAFAGVLAVQFLVEGASYGPRARRVLCWLGVPAAMAGLTAGAVADLRPTWLRVGVGLVVSVASYLALATACVRGWRERKVSLLVGDPAGLRRRLQERRREVERLFWQLSAERVRRPALRPPEAPALAVRVPEGEAVLRSWQAAEPSQAEGRAALIRQWRGEFARCGPTELLGRARVLEAAARDVPEDQRDALEARLAALWLAYAQTPGVAQAEGPTAADASPHARWEAARAELERLEQELAELLAQRGALLRRRLPLD